MENEEKAKELANKISADIQAGKKPPIINRFMKNFFFGALRSKSEVKAVAKEIGKLDSITLIFIRGKSILRANSKTDKRDINMTDEEVKKLFKQFNVKQESVDNCKTIFVQLNFNTKVIAIEQNKLDGTQSTLYI